MYVTHSYAKVNKCFTNPCVETVGLNINVDILFNMSIIVACISKHLPWVVNPTNFIPPLKSNVAITDISHFTKVPSQHLIIN